MYYVKNKNTEERFSVDPMQQNEKALKKELELVKDEVEFTNKKDFDNYRAKTDMEEVEEGGIKITKTKYKDLPKSKEDMIWEELGLIGY